MLKQVTIRKAKCLHTFAASDLCLLFENVALDQLNNRPILRLLSVNSQQ